ncbi:MAG: c-type cytochrome [Burkholderiaceae bacterium]|nr:c-type cytochrome [Burkholderiaceae bacterium]
MPGAAVRLNRAFLPVFIVLIVVALGGAAFVWSGVYNVAASSQHTQPVYALLEYTMLRSVRLRASAIETPPLDAPDTFERGAACYQDRCQLCHGGPGVAQADIALGMQPLPGPLINAASRWKARELFWITRNGITMSGMPAWRFQLSEPDMWAIVAFLERLPRLSPREYRDTLQRHRGQRCGIADELHAVGAEPVGEATRGRAALAQYGCNGCHRIPGITGAKVDVGPPLAGVARRQLIAGQMANTPEAMALWLRDPQRIDPLTAMPNLGVTSQDARDMAAYLATLQ